MSKGKIGSKENDEIKTLEPLMIRVFVTYKSEERQEKNLHH